MHRPSGLGGKPLVGGCMQVGQVGESVVFDLMPGHVDLLQQAVLPHTDFITAVQAIANQISVDRFDPADGPQQQGDPDIM